MLRASTATLTIAVALATSCAAPREPTPTASAATGKADGTEPTGVLVFSSDYEERLEGDLVAGGTLVVRYDPDRIQECRGRTGGSDVWGITGYFSVDGAEAESFAVTELRDGTTTAIDATLEVPRGAEIAFWFQSSNRWGCVAYDSDFGADYHFAIGEPEEPSAPVTIDLPADGSVSQSGPVVAGADVVVRYDLDRLGACRGTSRGYPQWSITGYYAVDDDEPTAFEVSRVEGADRVAVDAVLQPRPGQLLALWFQATNRWGCVAWDSRDGANYMFAME